MAAHKPSKLDVVGSNPTGVPTVFPGFARVSEQRKSTLGHDRQRRDTNENGTPLHHHYTKAPSAGPARSPSSPVSPAVSRDPGRSLEAALAELGAKFSRLPLDDPRRGRLAGQIRILEIEIDHRAAVR